MFRPIAPRLHRPAGAVAAPARPRVLTAAALLVASVALGGCAFLAVSGVIVGGATVASDRRAVGIQIEDEAIESRVLRALRARFDTATGNLYANSFNRLVLLTGQVADEASRGEAGRIAAQQENVKRVVNELAIGPVTSLGTRTADTAMSARVRAALLNAADVPYGGLLAHTDNAVVYLMGRVTEAEGDAAARVASRVAGVTKVVKVFEYLTPAEAATMPRTTPSELAEPAKK